jgi:hypothetical protein
MIWSYLRYFEAMAELVQRDRFDVLPPTCYDFLATLQKIDNILVSVYLLAEKLYRVWPLAKTQHLKAKLATNQPKIDQWCRQSVSIAFSTAQSRLYWFVVPASATDYYGYVAVTFVSRLLGFYGHGICMWRWFIEGRRVTIALKETGFNCYCQAVVRDGK